MLHQFTWQQFLVAAFILSLIWYGVVILLFYRKKIERFLNREQAHEFPEPLKREWDEDFEDEMANEESLMGQPRLPEGVSRVGMGDFGFAPKKVKTEQREMALGIVPDVLEELKRIFHILETEQGSKADFISLFTLVSSKYPAIRGTANQQALNDHIRENVLFPISDEELNNLWP